MAEINIDIKATDSASPVMRALESSARGATESLRSAGKALDSVATQRQIKLDVSSALAGARAVKAAINAIPDVSVKTVIVKYKTQASPVRPFTEGMQYIKKMMDSLPTEGTYKMRFEGANNNARYGDMATAARGINDPSSGQGNSPMQVTFSPTLNISGGTVAETGGYENGANLATEVDKALAELWRTGRSELRRAISQ